MKRISQIGLAILVFAAVMTGAEQVPTVRQIDFKNFTYAWSRPPVNVPLTWH